MFFNSKLLHRLRIKVAPYFKLPYVKDNRKYYNIDYTPYHNLHNTMHCVASDSFKTYFYNRDNVIYYHRKSTHDTELFILDNVSITYKPIRFKKLDIKIKDEKTILTKTKNDKWYIITLHKEHSSGIEYALIIDALSGTYLYKEKITEEDNIYAVILYPIANRVFPIIHFTRQNIYVNLFDIENESFYKAMTISLEDIDRLAKLIMNKSQDFGVLRNNLTNYKIDYIEDIKTSEFEYKYEANNKTPVYLRGARFELELNVKYKNIQKKYEDYKCDLYHIFCYIELDNEDLNCYLDFNKVTLVWDDRIFGEYNASDKKIENVINKYPLSGRFDDIYLSSCLYKDQCHHIYSTSDGIQIVKADKSYQISPLPKQASLYRYRNYLILFLYTEYASLIIIDTEHNKIGYWTCENIYTYSRIHYEQYYSKLQNNLIFLSNDLEILLIINVERLKDIFNSNKYSNCEENYNTTNKDNACNIVCSFHIKQLVAKAITHERGTVLNYTGVKLIRYYIDTGSDTLYILASYVINRINYVEVFSFRISCNHFTIRSLHYVPLNSFYRSADYIPISLFYGGLTSNIYRKLGISKIFLYNYDENLLRSSDIVYSEDVNRFLDIRYNRNSTYNSEIEYVSEQFNYKDFIAISYNPTLSSYTKLLLLLIRAELSLLRQMTTVYV